MKYLYILAVILCTSLSFASNNSIIVISIDALHPDAITAVKPENISKVMEKGHYTLNGKSIEPPKTLIAHTAMIIGKTPQESQYTSNLWKIKEQKVKGETIFHDAKKHGYNTYYVYSKQKLGFLENSAIDKSIFGRDDSISAAEAILKHEEKPFFLFLHISGLEYAGQKEGWMSKGYLDEFRMIDNDLKNIIEKYMVKDNVTIVITSDHAGHDKEHGTNNPEDYKLPFIIYSNIQDYSYIKNIDYRVEQLREIVGKSFYIDRK